MSTYRKPDIQKLQAACDKFNDAHKVGAAVTVLLDSDELRQTVTTSEAQVLSGHSAVIWLKGVSGCYELDRVTAMAPAAAALIQSVPVARDESGWWSHPGLPEFDEGQEEAYRAWIKAQGLVTSYATLDSENDTHPVYIAYFDEGGSDITGWDPAEPAGEGWFALSIHDTEDGPVWVWARREAIAAGGAV